MKTVRLTKLKDLRFEGDHSNGIHEGFVCDGILYAAPEVDCICVVGGCHTSLVTKVIDRNTFETENSLYKIEYL